jgi:hypothetical protein
MFIPGKDRHALEKSAASCFGIAIGTLMSGNEWSKYIGIGAFVVSIVLEIAAWVARRNAQKEMLQSI